jgi:hypothetical protein
LSSETFKRFAEHRSKAAQGIQGDAR